MKQTLTLLGAKRSKGTLDNGRAYDSTKLYVQTAMKPDNADQVGFAVSEYTWGDSSNFEKLQGLQFPCQADFGFEIVTNGKTSQIVVVDVQPLTKPNKI
jgi:hypothetical protein